MISAWRRARRARWRSCRSRAAVEAALRVPAASLRRSLRNRRPSVVVAASAGFARASLRSRPKLPVSGPIGHRGALSKPLNAGDAALPPSGSAGCHGDREEGPPVDPLSLLWLFFILASLQPTVQRQLM